VEPTPLDVTSQPQGLRGDAHPYSEVDLSTAEQADGSSILSPAATYDISVIGVFLGGGLAIALVVNHLGRAFSLSRALTASSAVMAVAFRGAGGAGGAQGNGAAPQPAAGGKLLAGADEHTAMTNTSNGTASFVFTSAAGRGSQP
jgi:hypothetical protein